MSGKQLTLQLEPGLLQRFPTLRQCVQWTVLNSASGMKNVARDIDMSLSDLSRRLHPSPGDPRSLDVEQLVDIMAATKDYTPIHWLVARFLPDDSQREDETWRTVEQLLPELSRLVAQKMRKR